MGKKMFDYVIGNPPYQEENSSNGRQPPVYHLFMDSVEDIAETVELITPARFLFNAGQTPKAWNKKKLNDVHFKVLKYQSDATRVFPNTDIKGGVAITIHNNKKIYGKINIFTPYDDLNSIINKTLAITKESITDICTGAVPYKYSDTFKSECPEWIPLAGHSFDVRTNALDKLEGKIYFADKPNDGKDYVQIYGLHNRKRELMWVRKAFIIGPSNFDKYKLLIPKANGAGKFGEALSEEVVVAPYIGHTQSFISIGNFESEIEVNNLSKYIKSKFCRCMLSVLRVTQDTTAYKWKYVPLQDFTNHSDIDWSQSIHDIDLQLYRKYGLDQKEIDFIETHVKEMA